MEAPKRKYHKHKTEVKISIKHQLNTNTKPVGSENGDFDLYPVYITVSVNKQFTRFRSRLRSLVPLNGLDQELKHPTNTEFINNELSIIENTIRLCRPEIKAEFKLPEWSKYYATGLIEVSDWANFIVNRKSSSIIRDEFRWSLSEYELLPSDTQSSLRTLCLLGSQAARDLLKEFQPILNLNAVEAAIRLKEGHNHSYCLWDIDTGFYQKQLRSFLGDDALPIIGVLEKLFSSVAYNEEFNHAKKMLSQKRYS